MLQGLIILLFFQLCGEALAELLDLPVPGAVIGMVLLWAGLHIKGSASAGLATASKTLIQHLSLLFLPAGVGLFFLPVSVHQHWLAVISAIVIATFISMIFCGLLLKLMASKRESHDG